MTESVIAGVIVVAMVVVGLVLSGMALALIGLFVWGGIAVVMKLASWISGGRI